MVFKAILHANEKLQDELKPTNFQSKYKPAESENQTPTESNPWKDAIQSNDLKLLKQMNLNKVEMTLSKYELVKIIESFRSVSFY